LHGGRMVAAVAENATVVIISMRVIGGEESAHAEKCSCGLGDGSAVFVCDAFRAEAVRFCYGVARFMYVMSERAGAENSRQHKQQHHMSKTRKHNPPAKVLLFSDMCKSFANKM